MHRSCRVAVRLIAFPMVLLLSGLLLVGGAGVARGAGRDGALRLLSEARMEPKSSGTPYDLRWASDHSVYLARTPDGVVEVSLEGKDLAKPLFPGDRALRLRFPLGMLAVSPSYLVAGTINDFVGWASFANLAQSTKELEDLKVAAVSSLDLRGDKLIFIGLLQKEKPFAPDGAIVFTGSLSLHLQDLTPLEHDQQGPGAGAFFSCYYFQMGAVRFLADGSMLVATGFQPGAKVYRPDGKLLRTFDTALLGIDTPEACAALDLAERGRILGHEETTDRWYAAHRILDEVLPFPEGPGFVIRWVSNGQVHWSLRVARPDGSFATYDIPYTSSSLSSRIKGDVRDGRIALLVTDRQAGRPRPSTLLVLEVPHD